MTKEQLQELRDNLYNAIFTCATLFKDDFEHSVKAPVGISYNDALFVDNLGDIAYTVSYNSKRGMVSLRGNGKMKDGSLKEIMSFDPSHFSLTEIVDKFIDFILA